MVRVSRGTGADAGKKLRRSTLSCAGAGETGWGGGGGEVEVDRSEGEGELDSEGSEYLSIDRNLG